jgi:hypothetical protein
LSIKYHPYLSPVISSSSLNPHRITVTLCRLSPPAGRRPNKTCADPRSPSLPFLPQSLLEHVRSPPSRGVAYLLELAGAWDSFGLRAAPSPLLLFRLVLPPRCLLVTRSCTRSTGARAGGRTAISCRSRSEGIFLEDWMNRIYVLLYIRFFHMTAAAANYILVTPHPVTPVSRHLTNISRIDATKFPLTLSRHLDLSYA